MRFGLVFLFSIFLLASNFVKANIAVDCVEGVTKTGYLMPIVNGFEQCTEATQMCVNGAWTGPFLYDSCDNPTEPCDGVTPHGTTEFGYTSSVAPCYLGTRTCIDGLWTGPELFTYCN